ncbi:hypothetical protein [Phyllobacterium leguminum]|uniref:Uncharacterized protein n=1 Tax=Phyllobacterium leguminum TaxID=314237 RepID=A0A318TAC5_9HYPH|nr:hypothetical protein [Phyllobacterium leguminum]PYE85268.1 hypothetical protein C7477_13313 [Phyllobacterium leguminum]
MSGEDRLKRRRGRPSNTSIAIKKAALAKQPDSFRLEEEALHTLESMAVAIAVIDHNLKNLMKNLAKKQPS